jgi:hypothetical protein
MKVLAGIFSLIVLAWLIATTSVPRAPAVQPCTHEWFSYLDSHYFDISDGEGHGPDLGSSEWLGSVEEKAGLQVEEHLPDEQRCQLIQNQLEHHRYIVNQQLGWAFSL